MSRVRYVVVSKTMGSHGASSVSEAAFKTIAEAIEYFDWVTTLPDNQGNVTQDWVERREVDQHGNISAVDCNIKPRFNLSSP